MQDIQFIDRDITSAKEVAVAKKLMPNTKFVCHYSGKLKCGLIIRNNSTFTYLPDNLTVNGNLDLTGCLNLISLPKGLTVKKDLILTDCQNFQKVPDDLCCLGVVKVEGCKSLVELPEKASSNKKGRLVKLSGLQELKKTARSLCCPKQPYNPRML